jgi:hypothetical protein
MPLELTAVAIFLAAASMVVSLVAAGPAVVSVRLIATVRSVAPLIRGTLEQSCTLGAALVAAASALSWAVVATRTHTRPHGLAFLLAASHPVIAAAPWLAGEFLSGPCRRPALSFLASNAVAAAASWGLTWLGFRWFLLDEFSPLTAGAFLAMAAVLVGLCATGTYLAVRGPPVPGR